MYYGGVHSFGITFELFNKQLTVANSAPVFVTKSQGLGHPGGDPNVTIMFQIKPLPKTAAECPEGRDCCNSLSVQSGHFSLNVSMADGSVKSITTRVDAATWANLMMPRDGNTVAFD